MNVKLLLDTVWNLVNEIYELIVGVAADVMNTLFT